MNCAACHEPMIVLELDQVEIDYCLACGKEINLTNINQHVPNHL